MIFFLMNGYMIKFCNVLRVWEGTFFLFFFYTVSVQIDKSWLFCCSYLLFLLMHCMLYLTSTKQFLFNTFSVIKDLPFPSYYDLTFATSVWGGYIIKWMQVFICYILLVNQIFSLFNYFYLKYCISPWCYVLFYHYNRKSGLIIQGILFLLVSVSSFITLLSTIWLFFT